MNKNNKKSNEDQTVPPTSYKYYLGSRERYIYINCDFEAANVQVVRQMSEFNVTPILHSTASAASTTDSKPVTGSTPKAGSTSAYTASPKTPRASS
jgi:hypothetical protein